jgi:ATP-dependent RNA helicase SUPV3L1/SUV3
VVVQKGKSAVALITGEEKIVPERAVYFVCTVEAMPLGRQAEFLAVDEIQLAADPARGHVFTQRLLHARGRLETMFLGSAAMAGLVRKLIPGVEVVSRERFSTLSYDGSKKLTRLPRRSAIVAFSAEQVYATAELIRRQRGGAAVVMGSLSPRTRNAQVALFQSGEVDFLVATDAIGMGLNMDVDHVAFAGLRKFDGKRTRWLTAPEVAQIAGRAGRFRRDGTFGVTGDCADIDDDLVRAVETHSFPPLVAAEWRAADLDFSALPALFRSLARPPRRDGLKLCDTALDEMVLKTLGSDPEVVERTRRPGGLARLWDVCQIPDFRKTTFEEHVRLVGEVFDGLTGARGAPSRLPEGWMNGHFQAVDHLGGDIEVLAQRLSGVRTLAYIANRPDWLFKPDDWRERTRALEDRLSDTLHERLMQRFIDRRTSVLMRSLHVGREMLAGVADDGSVTVEGQHVGRVEGVVFQPAEGSSALETKALRDTAGRAVAPEIARRLGRLAASGDEAFVLEAGGLVLWDGAPAGRLFGGGPWTPQIVLLGDLGPTPARERARARLEAFVVAEAGRRLGPLRALERALSEEGLKGLARGLAYRLIEAGGVLDRREAAAEIRLLSQGERRRLRGLGVRFSAFTLYCPALLESGPRAFYAAFARLDAPLWRPPIDRLSAMPVPAPTARARSAYGLQACGRLLVPVDALERLDGALRLSATPAGLVTLSAAALLDLGWSERQAGEVLRGLGYAPARRADLEGPALWRLRRPPPPPQEPAAPKGISPFAVLAPLVATPTAPVRRAPRRRRPRRKPVQAL